MSRPADDLAVDILNYFFDDGLTEADLNDPLRDLAAEMYHKALKISKLLDLVPRPPGGRPGIAWLAIQAVGAAWRRHKDGKIYNIARDTLKWQYRTPYQMAKMGL